MRAKLLVVGGVTCWKAVRSDGVIRNITVRTTEYILASNCSRNHFIYEKYKTVLSFKIISFTIGPLCNYTFLAAIVNVLEAFLPTVL